MGNLELQRLFQFDDTDLCANRIGELTHRQKKKLLEESRSWQAVLLSAAAVLMLAGGILLNIMLPATRGLPQMLHSQQGANVAGMLSSIHPTEVAILALPLVGLALLVYSRRLAPQNDLEVQRIEGPVRFAYVDKRVRSQNKSAPPYREVQILEMRVGENDRFFDVSERLPDHIQEGARYAFYYTLQPFRILSAELIGKAE